MVRHASWYNVTYCTVPSILYHCKCVVDLNLKRKAYVQLIVKEVVFMWDDEPGRENCKCDTILDASRQSNE